MEELAGRVAVVTGGAGGIGRAMAERFAAEGMRVVLADVEEPVLDTHGRRAASRSRHEVTGVVPTSPTTGRWSPCAIARLDAYGGSTCCATTPASAPGAEGPFGSTSATTGGGRSTSTSKGVIHGINAFVPGMVAGR